MQIAIYGKASHESFKKVLNQVVIALLEKKMIVVIHESLIHLIKPISISYGTENLRTFSSPAHLGDEVKFLISIGGDGTFLETIQFIRERNIPVIGINSGRLGFLADISKDELVNSFQAIFEDKFKIENRTLLQMFENKQEPEFPNYALNEICIHKLDNSAMITIHVYLGEEYLNSYWADGLIISTPTGSTAYNLSAGGPIVLPNSKSFILTPIAPHTLTVRPLVFPNQAELKIKVEGRSDAYLVSLDHRSYRMKMSQEISISKAPFEISLIKPENHSFLSTLRNKLAWGIDRRN
jgi:NAD+ kinase